MAKKVDKVKAAQKQVVDLKARHEQLNERLAMAQAKATQMTSEVVNELAAGQSFAAQKNLVQAREDVSQLQAALEVVRARTREAQAEVERPGLPPGA